MTTPIKLSEMNTGEILIPVTVTQKKSVEKNNVWDSAEITSTEYLPANMPFNQKLFLRTQMTYLNYRAILESLLLNSGTLTIHEYTDLMQTTEDNMRQLEEHYHTKAVSLVLVTRPDNKTAPKIEVKLFDTEYLCDYFLQGVYNVSLTDVKTGKLPPLMIGTTVQPQDWYSSKESVLTNYPNINDTDLKSDSATGGGL